MRNKEALDAEKFLKSLSVSNVMKRWGNDKNSALGTDFVRDASLHHSVNSCGLYSLDECKYWQNLKHYADVLRDYMFAVLYSGVVFVTFMGILGRRI